ncbi:MAG: helix-turn-helix transcriptional regulator [Clostridia bacterium]|nr:helix-turn-helix transcriptional regulator [Clostridia bacterium]
MKYSELNEKKTHGSASFPIEFYRVDQGHLQYVMPAHWHIEFEIIRVIHGGFRLYLNKQHYDMEAGDIAFVNSGVVHHGEPHDCLYECAVFKLDMLLQNGSAVNRYVKPLITGGSAVKEFFRAGITPMLDQAVDTLFDLLRDPAEHGELGVYSALYALMHTLYQVNAIEPSAHGHAQKKQLEQLTRLLSQIEEHYTEHIDLGELARSAGINEKYLFRFFKAYTSYTPVEYINRLRVEKAAYDIRHRHLSITEAAYANGFNDSAYFSKIFRRFVGISPLQYKREHAK